MWQHQLIVALLLLGATLAASLPANSPPIKDDFSIKSAESIDTEDENTSSTPPTDTMPTPSNDSQSSINVTQSNHTWPAMEDPNLFEGDMKVSKEIIEKYYSKLKEDNSTKVGFNNTIIIM